MNNLIQLLMENGLLQFGWFEPGGTPFRSKLDMLPAYPEALAEIITAAKPYTAGMNRLVCTTEALPFGVGLSLATHIPLVYSRGSTEAPSHDLVGAYDIGHPALLLVNTLDDSPNIARLVMNARSIGLQVHHMLSILDIGGVPMPVEVTTQALLTLSDVVNTLVGAERLPAGHAQAVLSWLKSRQ